MAIGGVSSATIRFRRPRGLKGPVADSFHKISQLEVKARELNRTLSMIDKSVNIVANIHNKLRYGYASEGKVGYGDGLIKGILGDLGLYGRSGLYDPTAAERAPGLYGPDSQGGKIWAFFRNINRDGFFGEDGVFQNIGHTIQQLQKGFELFKLPPDLIKSQLVNEFKEISKQVWETAEAVESVRQGMGRGMPTTFADKLREMNLNLGNNIKQAEELREKLEIVPPELSGKRAKLISLQKDTREVGVAERATQDALNKIKAVRNMPEAERIIGPDLAQLDLIGQGLNRSLTKLQNFRRLLNEITSDQHEHMVDGEIRWRKGIEWASDAQVAEVWESFNKIDSDKVIYGIKAARTQLEKFEETARKKSSQASKHINETADSVGNVTNSINESKDSVDNLANTSIPNFEKMEKSIDRMGKASENLSVEIKKLNSNLKPGGGLDKGSAKELGRALGGNTFIGGKFMGMSPTTSMGSLYAMVAPYLVTQNVVDFSKQMGTIRAETFGTDLNQDVIRNAILSVAGSSRFTAGDVATAVIGAVRSGFEITSDLRGIKHLASLAVAESVDLETAYAAVEPILNTLQVDLKSLPPIADKLSAATSTGATNLAELGWIAGRALSVHLETGGAFDEFFAIASILRSSGKGRDLTSTLLKNLQLSYSIMATGQGTKTQRETLQEIGVDQSQFYGPQGHLKSTIEISKMLIDAIKTSGTNAAEVIVKLFGKESGPTGLPLFSDVGLDRVAEAIESIAESRGAVRMKRRVQENTIYNQFQNIKSAGEEVTIRLFGGDERHFANLLGQIANKLKQFADFLKQNAHHINAFFDFLSKWFADNEQKIISFFRVVGASLLDVGKYFGKIIGFLTTFILKFQGLFATFLKFFLYFKIFNFFFGGIISFVLGGFAKTVLVLRSVGLAVATWTIYLGPFITRLLTTNKLLRSISSQIFGIIDAKNVKDIWSHLATTKVFDKDLIKEGLKKTSEIVTGAIKNTFKVAWDIAGKISKKGMEITGKIIKKGASSLGKIIMAPLNLGVDVIGSTGILRYFSEQFEMIKLVAVRNFTEIKAVGGSTFAALRATVAGVAIHIATSMKLAFLSMKADAAHAFTAMKAHAITTGTVVKAAFLDPRGTLKNVGIWAKGLSFAKVGGGLASLFTTIKGMAIIGPILTAITSAISAIVSAISAPFVAIGLAIVGIAVLIVRNWQKVKQYFASLWNFIKALFNFIITLVQFTFHFLDKKFPILGKIIFGIGASIKGFFLGIWEGLKAIGKWIEDTFIKTLDWIIEKLDKMSHWLKKFTHLMKTQMGIDNASKKSKVETKTTIEKTEKEVEKTIKESEKKSEKDIFQRKEIDSAAATDIASSGTFSRSSGPSIEFISFRRMNDLTIAIESGFQQLLNINSKILDVLSGGEGQALINTEKKTITTLASNSSTNKLKNSSAKNNSIYVVDKRDKGLQSKLPTPLYPATSNLQNNSKSSEKVFTRISEVSNIKSNSDASEKIISTFTQNGKKITISGNTEFELPRGSSGDFVIKLPSEQSIEIPEAKSIEVPSISTESDINSANATGINGENGIVVQNTFNITATGDTDIDELTQKLTKKIEESMKLNQFGKI